MTRRYPNLLRESLNTSVIRVVTSRLRWVVTHPNRQPGLKREPGKVEHSTHPCDRIVRLLSINSTFFAGVASWGRRLLLFLKNHFRRISISIPVTSPSDSTGSALLSFRVSTQLPGSPRRQPAPGQSQSRVDRPRTRNGLMRLGADAKTFSHVKQETRPLVGRETAPGL